MYNVLLSIEPAENLSLIKKSVWINGNRTGIRVNGFEPQWPNLMRYISFQRSFFESPPLFIEFDSFRFILRIQN